MAALYWFMRRSTKKEAPRVEAPVPQSFEGRSSNKEAHDMRSGLKPDPREVESLRQVQMKSSMQNSQHNTIASKGQEKEAKRNQDILNWVAANLIPSGPIDNLLESLKLVVGAVDQRSAKPIAILVRKELGDAECYAVMRDFRKGEKMLQAGMDKARKEYAVMLRDSKMADTTIRYVGDYKTIEEFKVDQAALEASGGTVYHYWVGKDYSFMEMCVLAKHAFLSQHYTKQKCGGHITMKVNTEPAAADYKPEPVILPRDCIFPDIQQLISPALAASEDEADRELRQQIIEEKMRQICGRRPRSDTLDAIRDAPKVPWNEFTSGKNGNRGQPDWTPLTKPFTTYAVPDNHSWWMDDLELRSDMIEEWHDKHTIKDIGRDKWGYIVFTQNTNITNTDSSRAVAGRDFQVLPALSKTNTTDRNHQWYEDHIKPAMAKALDEAERKYAIDEKTAKRLQVYVVNLSKQCRCDPSNIRLRVTFENMRNNLKVANWELAKSREQLNERREDFRTAKTPVVVQRAPEAEILNLPPLDKLLRYNNLVQPETAYRRKKLDVFRAEIKQTNREPISDEEVALAQQNNEAIYAPPTRGLKYAEYRQQQIANNPKLQQAIEGPRPENAPPVVLPSHITRCAKLEAATMLKSVKPPPAVPAVEEYRAFLVKPEAAAVFKPEDRQIVPIPPEWSPLSEPRGAAVFEPEDCQGVAVPHDSSPPAKPTTATLIKTVNPPAASEPLKTAQASKPEISSSLKNATYGNKIPFPAFNTKVSPPQLAVEHLDLPKTTSNTAVVKEGQKKAPGQRTWKPSTADLANPRLTAQKVLDGIAASHVVRRDRHDARVVKMDVKCPKPEMKSISNENREMVQSLVDAYKAKARNNEEPALSKALRETGVNREQHVRFQIPADDGAAVCSLSPQTPPTPPGWCDTVAAKGEGGDEE